MKTKRRRRLAYRPSDREILRVFIAEDGAIEVQVSVGWPDRPDASQELAKAVAMTVSHVFGGTVQEFAELNRNATQVH